MCGATEATDKAIKEIKEEINMSLTLTVINLIVYATASNITEQIGIEPKKYKKANSRIRNYPGKQELSEIFKQSIVIYQSYQEYKRAQKSKGKIE